MTEMPEELDVNAMIGRFRERAQAVRRRGIPPVEGEERRRIMSQMRLDFQDFAMLGDATGSLEDGILTLRVDLRPAEDVGGSGADPSGGAGAGTGGASGTGGGEASASPSDAAVSPAD